MAKELYARQSDVDRCVSDFHLISTPLGLNSKEEMLADSHETARSNECRGKGAAQYDGSASAKASSE